MRREPGKCNEWEAKQHVLTCPDFWLLSSLLLTYFPPHPTPTPTTSYFDALVELRHERMPDGVTLSWNDLQATVYQVNAQVQEETNREWSPGWMGAAHP